MFSGQYYLESQFIEKYGEKSNDFKCVNELGKASLKVNLHLFIAIFCVIVGVVLLALSTPKKIKKSDRRRPRRKTGQTILLLLAILSFILAFGNGVFYIYLYLSCFVPQRIKWFDSLDEKGKSLISQISFNQEISDRLDRLESKETSRTIDEIFDKK